MSIRISKKVAARIDAQRLYNRVRKYYPNTVKRAHDIIVKCLAETDKTRLDIFLGKRDEYGIKNGLSHERFKISFVHLDMCRKLEFIKEHKEEWTDNMLDWFARRLLKLPFKTIGVGKSQAQ